MYNCNIRNGHTNELINNKKGEQNARFKLVDGVSVQLTVRRNSSERSEETILMTLLTEQLQNVTDKRNRLIAETDYFALSDVTMSSDMTITDKI